MYHSINHSDNKGDNNKDNDTELTFASSFQKRMRIAKLFYLQTPLV